MNNRNTLNDKIRLNNIKYQIEIESHRRRQTLVNLIIPRFDIEDIVHILFGFLSRIIPFTKAYFIINDSRLSYNKQIFYDENKLRFVNEEQKNKGIKNIMNECIALKKGKYIINTKTEYPLMFQEASTCIALPFFVKLNEFWFLYIENSESESYSEKEFKLLREIMNDISLVIFNSLEISSLIKSKGIDIKDKETGLYNKYYFENIIQKHIFVTAATKQPFSLISIRVNKSDVLDIINISENILNYLKKTDTLFLIEKFHFVIFISDSTEETDNLIMKKLKEKLNLVNFIYFNYTGNELMSVTDILEVIGK